MDKPEFLYRGIKIYYNNLRDFDFKGDLVVNYKPLIKEGRKTVIDGNEYGVYMSDNLSMVEASYGKVYNDGLELENNILINNQRILIPAIAIIYKINTNNLDIRKPQITASLNGVYNNGFEGNEWICDKIPADNYEIYKVTIGNDILHNEEVINFQDIDELRMILLEKLEERKYHLEMFTQMVKSMSLVARNNISYDRLNILKMIYGQNGLRYLNKDDLDINSVEDIQKYLIIEILEQNEINLDFKTIEYILSLNKKAQTTNELIEILKFDKLQNKEAKLAFIKRKEEEKSNYNTSLFDKKEETIDNILFFINLKLENRGFKK